MQSCPSVKSQSGFLVLIPEQWLQIQSAFLIYVADINSSKTQRNGWENPIFSLGTTQSMLGAQSFSIASGQSKTIRLSDSFVSSLFSHIVLSSPGLHLNTSALLGKHLLHVCPGARKIVKSRHGVTWWYPTGWFSKRLYSSFID